MQAQYQRECAVLLLLLQTRGAECRQGGLTLPRSESQRKGGKRPEQVQEEVPTTEGPRVLPHSASTKSQKNAGRNA